MTLSLPTRRLALTTLLAAATAMGTSALAQTPAPTRSRLAATASYKSLTEWGKIRQALARTVGVQDVRIDAISIDGALLAILYAGSLEALRTELRRKGLILTNEDIGAVIRLSPGS